ncbi:conserved hypothetical protein [Cyanobium sp. PCC 7001]|uniref:hypothetical protein n=1 Tax=Cyanobium sp. PCC 7001 TaxID=180281 RepID=UPI0001804C56|nr:hypothetical protein [Cyanobium sp. PCC 7001]EDY39673.1 conserved hypothetical protein [Cyanobium sp. PCC 7001]
MAKDEISRADELTALGWAAEDVRRYAELWEYRQRWGAINLEREDRVFLRKAEAALPRRLTGKAAQKKTLKDKSYYRWLAFHRDAMLADPAEQGLGADEAGAWRVLLEAELQVLEELQPVLGLPDTLKARDLQPLREGWIEEAKAGADVRLLSFDFQAPLDTLKQTESTSWKPLRGETNTDRTYPVLAGETLARFRERMGQELTDRIRASFPSLRDGAGSSAPAA